MQHHKEGDRPDCARHERHPADRLPAIQAGAQPCITAPANSTRILRHGIDSLYVSFPGQLSEASQQQLSELKEIAQQESELVSAKAVLSLGEHRFCVAGHGRRRFPFVIDDNWFSVALASRTARSLPLAHAQIASELLTALGAKAALETLTAIVVQLGELHASPQISRSDLFVDFITDTDIENIPRKAWLKRAKKRAIYEDSDFLTGIAFGLGGDLSCRLYNKLEELKQSGKLYLLELWQKAGWNGIDPVWRLEFQLRRAVIQQLNAPTLQELLDHLGPIWSYLTCDWLRLTVPNPDDDTRTRWPTHPMWERIAALDSASAPSAARVTRARLPSDFTLFRQGLSGLTSYMARAGISELSEAIPAFVQAAMDYHSTLSPSGFSNTRLDEYVARKVNAKFRRFNTAPRHEPE